MPTVTIGHGMSPELAADVSTALQGMGVVVKANGFAPPSRQTKVIVVISPKGGSGKTAVSSNLAVALAQRFPGRVVAVDLDVQFGDLGTALSLTPEHTLAQLARTSQIDATMVKLFLTLHYNGLYVLAGANDPVDADSIGHKHVSEVLPLLAQNFDYVIVDTPAGLDERTLAAIECATDLLLVSSLDVTSIRSLRKALDALEKMSVKAERHLVLNRADAKVGLDPSDDMAFALAMGKLWGVHLNDQNGLKFDQDKSFGSSNLRQAYNQVRVLEEGKYADTGYFIGLDVKAMRTQKAEQSHLHLKNSKEIFLMLVDLVHSIDRNAWQGYVDARDYEGLELFIIKHLMGRR